MALELFEDANDGVKREKKTVKRTSRKRYVAYRMQSKIHPRLRKWWEWTRSSSQNFKCYWTGHLFKVSTFESFQTRFSFVPFFFLSGSLAVLHQQTTTSSSSAIFVANYAKRLGMKIGKRFVIGQHGPRDSLSGYNFVVRAAKHCNIFSSSRIVGHNDWSKSNSIQHLTQQKMLDEHHPTWAAKRSNNVGSNKVGTSNPTLFDSLARACCIYIKSVCANHRLNTVFRLVEINITLFK